MSLIAATKPGSKREKIRRRCSAVALVACVPAASAFAVWQRSVQRPMTIGKRQLDRTDRRKFHPSSFLRYTDNDGNSANSMETEDGEASIPQNRIPFVVKADDNLLRKDPSEEEETNDKISIDTESSFSRSESLPEDIFSAIQKVLTSPAVAENEEDQDHPKRLIIPTGTRPPADSKSQILSVETDASEAPVARTKPKVLFRSTEDWKKTWKQLRPGQKFRVRLGFGVLAFVTVWNTVIVRNYSSFISGIVTGAAATSTATGFGGVLGRWFSSRGFQGIAAFGRSIAYGWAILVAYPRMLDRRAKERRQKREEEALKQWRMYLKGTADEVVRLKRELSLLEGEIRTFRREILAIRAARTPAKEEGARAESQEVEPNNRIHDNSSEGSDRILREAIINEMTHLSRLRDDTRQALARARQRLSEVRSKKPITTSNTSTFDPFMFELEAAADLEYYDHHENGNDDLLLRGL